MIDEHFNTLLDLIEIEREAEKEENKRELEKFPLHVREALGKTVTKLQILDEDVGVGGIPLLILQKTTTVKSSGLSPFHAMNQGDNVRLSYAPESGLSPVDGTLYDVSEFQVTVAVNGKLPNPLPNSSCQLDMLGSDATYKRMRQAVRMVMRSGRKELMRIRDVMMGLERPLIHKVPSLEMMNKDLNEYQVEAVNRCFSTPDVAIIHGPPGTGKTTVLIEVIRQAVQLGFRVLASAPSNIAVDNMVEKLDLYDLRIVRLGHPARVMHTMHHVTLSSQQEDHEGQDEVRWMDEERHRLINQLRRKQQRGRGTSFHDRKDMESQIQRLWKTARDQEFAIRRQIIQQAQVVLATHGGVSNQLAKQKFDLIILDEASQATEPLSWIPITLGKKVILSGDSFQLPPTIYSKQAADQGLSTTLFDRLKEVLPKNLQTLLRIQYRMHEQIMKFSSDQFYEGKLLAHESVQWHTADELPGVAEDGFTTKPVHFIDTAGTGFEESWNDLLESRENEGEANLIKKVYDVLRMAGIGPHQIAILTPYVAQVKRLKMMITDKRLEIGSVDSFQGREKEVVIFGLVRSNSKGEVGFLSDTRRMNVGVTRARRLLIVIGDSSTIGSHPFYQKFLEYIDQIEAHESAWEWMDQ